MKKKYIFIGASFILFLVILFFLTALYRKGKCGDGVCQEWEKERASCARDCQPAVPPQIVCGNGICEAGENEVSCPQDCEGIVPPLPPPGPICGNSICEPKEDEINCPKDCQMKCQTTNSLKFLGQGKDMPLLSNSGAQPRECQVKGIVKMGQGSQPDYSYDGKLIAYTDIVAGDYEVFLMEPDGFDRRCITCDGSVPKEFARKHKGKPTFYPPDSRYLLFSVENEHGDHGLTTAPGIGDNHDLWMTNLETGEYWRLTWFPRDSAIQYPRFSGDGKKLLWSDRYEKERLSIRKKGCEWGFWKLELADFAITQDGPKLTNIIGLEPGGKGYYEPHGFFPGDNNKIIMTAMIKTDKSAFYGEFYTYDLASQKLDCLAAADDIHYEMALYSSSGNKIAFMSGPFLGVTNLYKADLYLMDADGKNRVRLTFFNEPGHKDYAGANVQIQKESWSPDGTQMVSAYLNHKTKESTLFMINFAGPCGKQ